MSECKCSVCDTVSPVWAFEVTYRTPEEYEFRVCTTCMRDALDKGVPDILKKKGVKCDNFYHFRVCQPFDLRVKKLRVSIGFLMVVMLLTAIIASGGS